MVLGTVLGIAIFNIIFGMNTLYSLRSKVLITSPIFILPKCGTLKGLLFFVGLVKRFDVDL